MAIWQAIRDDHDRFDELFEEIENAESAEDRARLIAALRSVLEAHLQAEENSLYPRLAQIAGLAERMTRSKEDHAAIRKLAERIVAAGEDEQLDLLTELEDLVQDHVEEEEDEIIPKAEGAIGEAESVELERRFEAAKQAAESQGR